MGIFRIAILDDYQYVAREYADWDSLDAQVKVFRVPIANSDAFIAGKPVRVLK